MIRLGVLLILLILIFLVWYYFDMRIEALDQGMMTDQNLLEKHLTNLIFRPQISLP